MRPLAAILQAALLLTTLSACAILGTPEEITLFARSDLTIYQDGTLGHSPTIGKLSAGETAVVLGCRGPWGYHTITPIKIRTSEGLVGYVAPIGMRLIRRVTNGESPDSIISCSERFLPLSIWEKP